MRPFYENFPFFQIIICLMSGVICSVLKKKQARVFCYFVLTVLTALSVGVLLYTLSTGEAFVYRMGHFDAPYGNEIRAGVLEASIAVFFCIIMFLSVLSGERYLEKDIEQSKINLYYTLVSMMMSALLALTYTNDLFTGYVFVEINTITAAGLIAIKKEGVSYFSAIKYMVMSLLGSGMLLIGITLLYDVTGHLLLSNIQESVNEIVANGLYSESFTVIVALLTIGLSIKCALFPFHSWLPDAYTTATVASSSILSSLVSKSYIVFLIKIFYRAIGWENVLITGVNDIIFVFGLAGMIIGSLLAIAQTDIKRMVAYSSVAQIGYIFMGLGMGTTYGVVAAIFHIFMHGATKSMIFASLGGLTEVSSDSSEADALKGSGFRNKVAGVAFAAGACSMVSIPLLPGFISKLNFAAAACELESDAKLIIVMVTLAVSTILNCIYFFRALIGIYTPVKEEANGTVSVTGASFGFTISVIGFILVNLALGIFSSTVMDFIRSGLDMFS